MSNILVNNDNNLNAPSDEQLAQWAEAVLKSQHNDGAEVSLSIVNEEQIQSLNKTYRGKDKSTNVLSFEADIPPELEVNILGDVIICPEVVESEAIEYNMALEQRWAHMVCHGILHLLGYDHIDPHDQQQMEALETQLLQSWGYTSPYLSD